MKLFVKLFLILVLRIYEYAVEKKVLPHAGLIIG